MSDAHAQVEARQASYQKAAAVADRLLAKGLPLVGFDAFDLGRKVAFLFDLTQDGDSFGERYVCKLPIEEATEEAVEAQYRRFAG